MSEGAGDGLTPSQLAHLAAVQDRLIPPEGDLPGAGQSGAAGRVERLLAQRPEWRPEVLVALQEIEAAALSLRQRPGAGATPPDGPGAPGFLGLAADERDAALRAVEGAHPHAFRRLQRLTYVAYYTDAAVQRAHGFGAEPPLPRGYPQTAFDESRLDPVRGRGKQWRDA